MYSIIRGLLSADLATQYIIPELAVDTLFKQFDKDNKVLRIAKDSIERKKQEVENEKVLKSDQSKILKAIKAYALKLEGKIPESSNKRSQLESILTEYSYVIKSKYYQ